MALLRFWVYCQSWLKVEVDGDECYVAKDYVELSDQLQKAMTMTEIKYGAT
jgi:hypothetical protein